MSRLLARALPVFLALASGPVLGAQPAPADAARFEILTRESDKPPEPSDTVCTADGRWCMTIDPTIDGQPVLVVDLAGRPGPSPRLPLAKGELDDPIFAIWPGVIRLGGAVDGVLVGVTRNSFATYSGGGGGVTWLDLFRVTAGGQAVGPVVAVPLAGNLMIRACFSERDTKRRLGACQDEYGFSAILTLAERAGGEWPDLVYQTQATAFPRGVSRSKDSLEGPPLTRFDLVQGIDPRCSYHRSFAFDPAAGVYQPNAALPDCSDYTVP